MYNQNYFNNGMFDTDYSHIAVKIKDKYQPKSIIEFGCGPGNLTIALANIGINVTAIDGYSNPDFGTYKKIQFFKIDLNNSDEIETFLISNTGFDLAICTEVAEHLLPESSEHLIKFLTQSAPVVIFSAAVPNQNGHGHINCQNRHFWHKIFKQNNFFLVDSIRKELQQNDQLAIWYKLNILDYVSEDNNEMNIKSLNKTIENLLFNESNVSSMFHGTCNILSVKNAYLNYFGIKQYMMLRNFLKNLKRK